MSLLVKITLSAALILSIGDSPCIPHLIDIGDALLQRNGFRQDVIHFREADQRYFLAVVLVFAQIFAAHQPVVAVDKPVAVPVAYIVQADGGALKYSVCIIVRENTVDPPL